MKAEPTKDARPGTILNRTLDRLMEDLHRSRRDGEPQLRLEETGTVGYVGHGIARITGLPGIRSEELVRFPGNRMGLAFNLDAREVGVVLLDEARDLEAGAEARRTGRVLDFPVGEALLGRVVDALGRPLDGGGSLRAAERKPVEREAPSILDRAPVTVPLQTGLKVVDALIPVGRGQRELILGDRQTGKTAVAMDTVLNQKDTGVYCIYCFIGQRSAQVAETVSVLREHGALDYTSVVATTEEDPPGLRFAAPYAAMTLGECFRDRGDDALVVFDDLTRHARAYREISLLLRRPPGREAYPGDVFYIHSRLLERSTRLKDDLGGGSLTALPIIETQAQNLSAYIPTNLISITDGQIYLSPKLFQKGFMPAVDVGRSVSRVGGKAQLPAYREVAGDLRLTYSQFEELESFARFATRLDDDTRKTLERGRRVRRILKQPRYEPLSVAGQMAVLVAVSEGRLDPVPLDAIAGMERRIRREVPGRAEAARRAIEEGEELDEQGLDELLEAIDRIVETGEEDHDADA